MGNAHVTGPNRSDLGGPNVGDYDEFLLRISDEIQEQHSVVLALQGLVVLVDRHNS
jgi:hypothetical protein